VQTKAEGVREWMLRKIFGLRKDKATGECRILHKEEPNDL
jgi:hypothetical protein